MGLANGLEHMDFHFWMQSMKLEEMQFALGIPYICVKLFLISLKLCSWEALDLKILSLSLSYLIQEHPVRATDPTWGKSIPQSHSVLGHLSNEIQS